MSVKDQLMGRLLIQAKSMNASQLQQLIKEASTLLTKTNAVLDRLPKSEKDAITKAYADIINNNEITQNCDIKLEIDVSVCAFLDEHTGTIDWDVDDVNYDYAEIIEAARKTKPIRDMEKEIDKRYAVYEKLVTAASRKLNVSVDEIKKTIEDNY